MTWLQRLKNNTCPPLGLPKPTKVPTDPLSSVLTVSEPCNSEKYRTRLIVKWRLPYHPPYAWVTAIGRAGVDRDKLVREILARWPDAHIHSEG